MTCTRSKLVVGLGALAMAMAAGACDGEPAQDEALGQVELEIATVPGLVQCIAIQATGSSVVSKTFPVTPGGSPGVLGLGNLPLGPVVLSGQAFNEPCASIAGKTPSWLADPIDAQIRAGSVPRFEFVFRRNSAAGGTVSFEESAVAITMGKTQAFAIMGDGTLRGWGADNVGQLGNGPGVQPQLAPQQTNVLGNLPPVVSVISVSAKSSVSCAVLAFGSESAVKCFGMNEKGQVGTGGTPPTGDIKPLPSQVVGLDGLGVREVATGSFHVCALTAGGNVLCWGDNSSGQLGLGATNGVANATPGAVMVPGGATGPQQLANVVEIGAGNAHTCVRYASGSVDCWGANFAGQLGIGGGGNPKLLPTPNSPIANLPAVTRIAVGDLHTCALKADHTVWCWGENGSGQLGDGTPTNRNTPAQVPLPPAVDVAAGTAHTCAVLADGTVRCWGAGRALGNGTGFNSFSPVQVDHIDNAVAIDASIGSCALLENGAVECWGPNDQGVLGTGDRTASFVPVPVAF